MQSNIPMTEEEKEAHRQKKTFALAVKLILYVICAGTFGAFTRWMQVMLTFDETGLNSKSAWNVLVPLVIIAAAFVFLFRIDDLKKHRYYVSKDLTVIFHREGKLFVLIPWALGGLMFLGGAAFFLSAGDNRNEIMMRCIALCAMATGVSYPILMNKYMDSGANPALLSLMAFFPILMYTLWLILTYKINSINSIIWAYGVEILAVCAAMMGFFRMAGFAFDRPEPWRAIFGCMFGGFMCITALADSRSLGEQVILIASACMFVFDLWVMVTNLRQGEPHKKVNIDDGFEHIQYRP